MSSAAPAALSGVRVLDLSRILAGPFATQSLGDLGADVIKVEKPGEGDDTRRWGPPFLPNGDAAYFLAANRNKRSVEIDFTTAAGADLVRRLAAKSHVLVENYKTGGLAKYKLDYASLATVNPALVYCSITGFGQDGPYAERAGYDYLIQAMGGLMSITGAPEGEPMKVGVAVADLFTGLNATIAILAALRHAEATGQGQHIDMALFDCQAAMLANQAMNYFVSGRPPGRLGNAHPNIAPYQVFAAADGHFVLAVGNDGQWRAFCAAAGLSRLAEDPRFAANAGRVANRAALGAALEPVLKAETVAHWLRTLEAANVPCGPINDVSQVFDDPQAVARGLAQSLERPDGPVMLVASPLRLAATPPVARRPPPPLGQDTDAVLSEWLGAAPADLAAWRAAGVTQAKSERAAS